MNRKLRNSSPFPAITPQFPPRPITPYPTSPALEIARLKGLLAAERRRHHRLESALAKFNAILEKVITNQRQAFEQLHSELIPNVLKRGQR